MRETRWAPWAVYMLGEWRGLQPDTNEAILQIQTDHCRREGDSFFLFTADVRM